MSPQTDDIAATIRAFITANFPAAKLQPLGETDSLLDEGIVDSLGIMQIVEFVETDLGVAVLDEDLTPENFDSIRTLVEFVARKRSEAA